VQVAHVLPVQVNSGAQLLIDRLSPPPLNSLDDSALFPLRDRGTLKLLLALAT